jgi:hypothetical protein
MLTVNRGRPNIRRVSFYEREIKEARQGVVGLCRASGIHYKREKKADTSVYFVTSLPWLLYGATHKSKFVFSSGLLGWPRIPEQNQ